MTVFLNCCYKCDKNTKFTISFLHVQVCNNCGNKIRPALNADVIKYMNRLSDLELSQLDHDSQ